MRSIDEEAIETFSNWNIAFNSRDVEKQISYMHFPHLRLANNKFELWEKANDFRESHEEMTTKLISENCSSTETISIEPVQFNEDKVHLAITQARKNIDGFKYNVFDTLWIFTIIDGDLKVQFRSSFLKNTIANGVGGIEVFSKL